MIVCSICLKNKVDYNGTPETGICKDCQSFPPIRIVKQAQPFDIENGDFLYGSSYIADKVNVFENDRISFLPLVKGDISVWSWLEKLGIAIRDIIDFRNTVTYWCPWEENQYYWMIPLVLATNNPDAYKLDKWRWHRGFTDQKLSHAMQIKDEFVNSISIALMGHGFTEGTLPDDGLANKELVIVELSNGDRLICLTWVWHNK